MTLDRIKAWKGCQALPGGKVWHRYECNSHWWLLSVGFPPGFTAPHLMLTFASYFIKAIVFLPAVLLKGRKGLVEAFPRLEAQVQGWGGGDLLSTGLQVPSLDLLVPPFSRYKTYLSTLPCLGFGEGWFGSLLYFLHCIFLIVMLKAGTQISAGSLGTCEGRSLHDVSVDRWSQGWFPSVSILC